MNDELRMVNEIVLSKRLVVHILLLGKELLLGFAVVGIVHAAVDRTYGGTLRFIVKAHAFGTFIAYYIICIHSNRLLGRISLVFAAGSMYSAFKVGSIGKAPFGTSFINGIVGALRFASATVYAFIGNHYGHSISGIKGYFRTQNYGIFCFIGMTLDERTSAFIELGRQIRDLYTVAQPNTAQQQLVKLAETLHRNNPWFTPENVRISLAGIGRMLEAEALYNWLSGYDISGRPARKVALIMAGNIPAVGFHDLLCVLLSGHNVLVKLSSEDDRLIPALVSLLVSAEPRFNDRIQFTTGPFPAFDAVIATGSGNTSRYFEHYFGRYPHIIRRNRSSAAVLTGAETRAELEALGTDIFTYFGLGCRNVSKLYVPEAFSPVPLLDALEGWSHLSRHTKYLNNYEYNKAIFLVNRVPHFDNGFLLLREDIALHSPVSVLYYETYSDLNTIHEKLTAEQDRIQCVVSSALSGISTVHFGASQQPGPGDYADRVDTLDFLLNGL